PAFHHSQQQVDEKRKPEALVKGIQHGDPIPSRSHAANQLISKLTLPNKFIERLKAWFARPDSLSVTQTTDEQDNKNKPQRARKSSSHAQKTENKNRQHATRNRPDNKNQNKRRQKQNSDQSEGLEKKNQTP